MKLRESFWLHIRKYSKMLIYSFIGWGITNILVNGSIFDEFRNYCLVMLPKLGKLLTCMQCSGFWVGFLMGLLNFGGVIQNPWAEFFHFQGEIAGKFQHFMEFVLLIFTSGVWISGASVTINTFLIFLARISVKRDI
jgi:hypothetical protein